MSQGISLMTFSETSQNSCLHNRDSLAAWVPGSVDTHWQRCAGQEKWPWFYPYQKISHRIWLPRHWFTILNIKKFSIICKLNIQLSCLKCLDKKVWSYQMFGRCATSHHTHNTLFQQHGVLFLQHQCCWQQDRARSLTWNNLHGFPTISCPQLQGYNHYPSSTVGSRPCKPAAAKAVDSIQRTIQLKTT